jgi:hypothetical protein
MVENKLVSDKNTNKESQKSFATESGWEMGVKGYPVHRGLKKNQHSQSKDIPNALVDDVGRQASDRFHKKVEVFSRFRDNKFGNMGNEKVNVRADYQSRSSSNAFRDGQGEYSRSSQNIKKNRMNSKRNKSGFKGFQGTPEPIKKNDKFKTPYNNQTRNNSQPVGYSKQEQHITQNKSFESEEYEKIFGKPRSRIKNLDQRPITGMSQEMILSNYYPLASMDKKRKKHSAQQEEDNTIISKTRFDKLAKKWMPSKEHDRRKPYQNSRKSTNSNFNQPIQIIQQININQVKKNTINIMQYGRKFPNQRKSKTKQGMKKQASVPQRKTPKPKTVPKKPNTNDPYKNRTKRKTPYTNLRQKTNRLKVAHQQMTKSGIIPKAKKQEVYGMQSTDRMGYRLKHLKKPSSKVNGLKKRKDRAMNKNFGRIKAATTSINKKSYQYGSSKNQYVKKRAVAVVKKNKLNRGYKDIQQMAKKNDFKSGHVNKKNTRSSNYGNARSRASKTPNYNKFSPLMKKKPGNKRTSKTTSMKRPFSLYDSKQVKDKQPRPEKKPKKRYFFKSQKNKEKQVKREMRLKEEMKKLNEQSKKKKDESKIMQYGYNMLEKRARKSGNAKELLNLVKKNKQKPKRKTRPKMNNFPSIQISTMPINKLKHFRDSLKTDKQNNTLSPGSIKKKVHKLSEARSSGENFYINNHKDFISTKVGLNVLKPGRAVSFEQSKKLHERRSRKYREKNRMHSLKQQKTNKEVKLALEHVRGTLKDIESIRRSGLREKTTRSLSKKIQKFLHEKKESLKIMNRNVEMEEQGVNEIRGKDQGIEESQVVKVCDDDNDQKDNGNKKVFYDICLDDVGNQKTVESKVLETSRTKEINDSPEKKIIKDYAKDEKIKNNENEKQNKNVEEKSKNTPEKVLKSTGSYLNLAIKKHKMRHSLINNQNPTKKLKKNFSMVEKIPKKFTTSFDLPSPACSSKKTETINQPIQPEEPKPQKIKDSVNQSSKNKIQTKLKQQLFSEQNSKSINDKQHVENNLNTEKNIQIVPFEKNEPKHKSKKEIKIVNQTMFSSNVIGKKTRSNRDARMQFMKFNSKNPMNKSQGDNRSTPQNINILQIKIEDPSNLASPKNVSSPTNLDFIEKINLEKPKIISVRDNNYKELGKTFLVLIVQVVIILSQRTSRFIHLKTTIKILLIKAKRILFTRT